MIVQDIQAKNVIKFACWRSKMGFLNKRRGGMTVLGKIAVPKPINLPCQRLENHGLYPNVDIVPKCAPTWSNRSSTPHAWNSSASPKNTSGSTFCLDACPSSVGSGRPSTADSEKSFDYTSSSRGSNSRPSSASGLMTSSQISATCMCSHSAVTRPDSSQLFCFVEPMIENLITRQVSGSRENLAVEFPKNKEFSLSSRDFPSLGSKRNVERHTSQGHSSHDYPRSPAGKTSQKEVMENSITGNSVEANADCRAANSWKRENPPNVETIPPIVDRWQSNAQHLQLYPHVNMYPYSFEPWKVNHVRTPPKGICYRACPPAGPYNPMCPSYGPYSPAGPFRGHPFEPFPVYNTQLPIRPVSNSQATPRSGPGVAPMSDPYVILPHVITMRPGVFTGPLPCDGYYGPSQSMPDAPIPGFSFDSCVYNKPPSNFASELTHIDSGDQDPNSTRPEHSDVTLGPCKLPVEQHALLEAKGNEGEKEHRSAGIQSDKGNSHDVQPRGNDNEINYRKDEISYAYFGTNNSLQPNNGQEWNRSHEIPSLSKNFLIEKMQGLNMKACERSRQSENYMNINHHTNKSGIDADFETISRNVLEYEVSGKLGDTQTSVHKVQESQFPPVKLLEFSAVDWIKIHTPCNKRDKTHCPEDNIINRRLSLKGDELGKKSPHIASEISVTKSNLRGLML